MIAVARSAVVTLGAVTETATEKAARSTTTMLDGPPVVVAVSVPLSVATA